MRFEQRMNEHWARTIVQATSRYKREGLRRASTQRKKKRRQQLHQLFHPSPSFLRRPWLSSPFGVQFTTAPSSKSNTIPPRLLRNEGTPYPLLRITDSIPLGYEKDNPPPKTSQPPPAFSSSLSLSPFSTRQNRVRTHCTSASHRLRQRGRNMRRFRLPEPAPRRLCRGRKEMRNRTMRRAAFFLRTKMATRELSNDGENIVSMV
ncbi:hypothetical protein LX36DRAFT_65290 [Colletotrichum falcatum]|nr:hypothetical protein LX36DRAFT_65290 [Colletotrichum falcatum]